MADITITIPPAQEQRVQDAFTETLGLESPATLTDVKDWIIADIKQLVRSSEKRQDAAQFVPPADPDIT